MENKQSSACCLLVSGFVLDLLHDTADGGSTFLRNVFGFLPDYMALLIGRRTSREESAKLIGP
jgi:hypothetical protein